MTTGRFRCSFALAALLALPACAAQPPLAAEPAAAEAARYAGSWGYRQSCGRQHSAHLELYTDAAKVSGTWDDGNRSRGDGGSLSGAPRDGRLYLRFCNDGAAAGQPGTCPDFGPESAYLLREGQTLVWYRASGDAYRPYLTLHPAGDGRGVPDDTHGCEDAAADD